MPAFSRCGRSSDKAKSINNLKQIGIALAEFDSHYGYFPQQEFPEELTSQSPEAALFIQKERDDSNYLLGQLIYLGFTDSEKIFDMGHSVGPEFQADDVYDSKENLLQPGECEVAYLSATGNTPLNSLNIPEEAPLALSQVIPGTSEFDPDYDRGEIAYLRGDSSVATTRLSPAKKNLPIRKPNKQQSLFDSGPDTLWPDGPPKIHYPLPYDHKKGRPFITPRSKPYVTLLTLALTLPPIFFFLFRKILR